MIIAILEDRKQFRRSVELSGFRSSIQIPISPSLLYSDTHIPEKDLLERITFYFYKWLEKNKVALYRENRK